MTDRVVGHELDELSAEAARASTRRIDAPGRSAGRILCRAHALFRRPVAWLRARSGVGRRGDWLDPAAARGDREAALRDALAAAELVRAALSENGTRLRLALAVAEVGVWELDLTAARVRLDERAVALAPVPLPAGVWLAQGAPEIRALLARIDPADRPRRQAALQRLMDGAAEILAYDHRIEDGRGGWRHMAERAAVLARNPMTGRPRRIVGIIRDVTAERDAAMAQERLVAERTAALAQSERRFRSIFESSHSLVLLLTPEGRVLEANQRWLSFFQRDLADVQGQPFWLLASADDAQRVKLKQERVARAAAGETVRYEIEMRGPAGRRAIADVSIEPIRDAHGAVATLVIEARDITEQVRLQAQLARAQKMEAVGQLTGGVAHDFNNLLQAVCGNLDLIRGLADGMGDVRLQRLAGNAQRAVARGARLTQQLLAFSRRQNLQPERVWIGRMLAETGELLARAAGEKVQVSSHADPALWPCQIDPGQFESALFNLVINARDAMPGGGTLTVTAANVVVGEAQAAPLELPAGAYVRVEVADTGTGIAPEHLPRLFEPFFTTKEVGKGTGLGLAMVHGFARQSGGAVTIASEFGCGTTVTLHLPREVVAETAAPPQESRAVPAAIAPAGPRLHILVVEDDAEVLDAIEFALLDAGHRVLTAGDAAEALAVVAGQERVDLLLCDIVLPGAAGGIEVAEAAARLRPGLRVLLSSGYGEEVTRPGVAHEVLSKPFSQAELLRRIAATANASPVAATVE